MSFADQIFAKSLKAQDGWFIPAGAISGPAAESLDRLISSAKHGGSADLILRVDGRETRWQADWIKYARRLAHDHPIGHALTLTPPSEP
jgi:hypothetical protein